METQGPRITKRLNEYLKTSQNKSYFVISVTVLFVVLVILVGIIPAVSAISLQRSENKKRDEVITKLESKLATLKSLTGESTAKKSLVDYLNAAIVDEIDQASFLTEIDSLVEEENLFLTSVSFDFPDNVKVDNDLIKKYQVSSQLKSQSVNILLEGSMDNIKDFVSKLESTRRIKNVESVTLAKKGNDGVTEIPLDREYRLSITVQYFYYSQNTTTLN
jgi:Tfp pilus assembly protein PilO